MIKVNVLIVEDNNSMQEMINVAVRETNKGLVDLEFSVVAVTVSADEACWQLRNFPVGLVFLDLTLKDGKDRGLEVIRKFPELPYIIISGDRTALEKAINETSNGIFPAFKYKGSVNGTPSIEEIKSTLRKFIDDKNKAGGFHAQIIKVNGINQVVDDIAFISKQPQMVNENNQIVVCTDCYKCMVCEHDCTPNFCKDKQYRLYFHRPVFNPSKNHANCLYNLSIAGNYSIANVIDKLSLNPKQFIAVSQSTMINLKMLRFYDAQSDHSLYFEFEQRKAVLKPTVDFIKKDKIQNLIATRHNL